MDILKQPLAGNDFFFDYDFYLFLIRSENLENSCCNYPLAFCVLTVSDLVW